MEIGQFYNTIKLQGTALEEAKNKANKQECRILAYFVANPNSLFTGYDVQEDVFNGRVPRHSISRALTNLKDAGYIEKTEIQVVEKYGTKNHTWKLKFKEPVQQPLFGGDK
jgi:hypothetical protein